MVTQELTISQKTFTDMISGLIASGVTFKAFESTTNKNYIIIQFLGGY